jgi:putative hemolysin
MQVQSSQNTAARRTPGLRLCYAQNGDDLREAQRLRYKVFAGELGARLPAGEAGIDRDIYDPYCDHLLVRDGDSNEVVGTYRILSAAQAKKIGGYYSQAEFDLTRLAHLSERMMEVGRACVHPDYRSGAVISLLWAGLAKHMLRHRAEYLIGCASIGVADGGHVAASLYNKLKVDHLSPVEWRVFPRCALPLEALNGGLEAPVPPLIKGYLRVGAYICGEPAWDPDFNTADLLVFLPLAKINRRYAMRYMKI